LNLCIHRPTRVHNRYDKWIGSVVFAQLTAESAYTLQWAPPIHQNCPFLWGIWTSHVTHDAFGHTSPQPKRYVDWFSRLCTNDRGVSLYFTMVCLFSVNIAPSRVGIWTSSSFNTWFIGPTRVRNANGNLIVSAVFAGLTDRQRDRKTDRPRYSVRCGVIMRTGNYVGYGKAAIV